MRCVEGMREVRLSPPIQIIIVAEWGYSPASLPHACDDLIPLRLEAGHTVNIVNYLLLLIGRYIPAYKPTYLPTCIPSCCTNQFLVKF